MVVADTYGLGADTLKTGAENVKFTGVKVYETAYRRVAHGLFVGAGLNFSSAFGFPAGTTACCLRGISPPM